jgi:hypothetical protein
MSLSVIMPTTLFCAFTTGTAPQSCFFMIAMTSATEASVPAYLTSGFISA